VKATSRETVEHPLCTFSKGGERKNNAPQGHRISKPDSPQLVAGGASAAGTTQFISSADRPRGVLHALSQGMLSDAHILVADDDALVLDSITDALAGLGARVVRAATGAELIDQLAAAGPFDLVITDVAMPWMNGLTAMRAARTAGLAMAVIVMTARHDERIPAQVRSLGPNAVLLQKPFGLADLEEIASRLIARRHAVPAGTADR